VVVVALLGSVAAHRAARPATGWKAWGTRLALLWFLLPITLTFAVSQFKPMFVDRYLLVALPGLILLVGAALTLRPRWLGAAAVVVVFAFSARGLVFWFDEYKKEDWRTAARTVLEQSRPGDAIAFVAFSVRVPFEYYLRQFGGLPPGVTLIELASTPYYYGGVMPPPNLPLIRSFDEKHPRVWLVQSHTRRPAGKLAIAPIVRAELSEDYFEERRSVMPGVVVSRYRLRGVAPAAEPSAPRRN
jgi:hypothetical protein